MSKEGSGRRRIVFKGQMKNTLLIDDDFDHLAGLAVALVEAGYQVIPKIDADSVRHLIAV